MAKKKIMVTLVRSPLGRNKKHRRTVEALGLKKIGQTVEHKDDEVIRGMVNAVNHLVNVDTSS